MNTLNVPFVFDDIPNIVNNKAIQIQSLDIESLRTAGFQSLMSSRPLANISFAVNYYYSNLNVPAYHIVNILIHVINGILVYLLSVFLLSNTFNRSGNADIKTDNNRIFFISLIAACIFIAHPIQIQSVTYIVQRMNSLATMFYLMALLAYLYGRSSHSPARRNGFYFVSLSGFMFALASKEIAAMLPITIILIEWLLFNNSMKECIGRYKKRLSGFFFLAILVALFFLGDNPVDRVLADYTYREFSLWERLLTELRVVVFYISLILVPLPSRLNLIHNFEISSSIFQPFSTLLSLIFILSLLVLAFKLARNHKLYSLCVFWFFLHLVIESSFIGLEIIFEHRLYLPMVGVSLIGSLLLAEIFSNNKILHRTASIALVVTLSIGTVVRNKTWGNEETLWLDVASKNQLSYRAFYNLGNIKSNSGEFDEAVKYFQQALLINSGYSMAHNNLGIALNKQGNTQMAMFHYKISMAINPLDPSPNYNLGIALDSIGNTDEAIAEYKKAIEKSPDFISPYYNLANLYERIKNFDDAKYYYELTLRLDSYHARANNNLGIIQAEEGQFEDAERNFQNAILGDPEFSGPYINLIKLYLAQDEITAACNVLNESVLEKDLLTSLPIEITSLCNK